ncbi:MAG: tripartite tricarboxylate transporter substrate binding protein, partial [Rhodoferax sp.]|nr:tripartite tricarboxylate transporter substrate binding protein [Rhodoferax sp.]MCB2042598.1 tripartite tricarboxylate transporter substrate binding protein [Rhodoferax sp.]
DVLARMSEQLVKALNSPDIRDKIAQTGDVPAGTQAEFADLLKGEHVRWERTVKAANITPN